MAGPRVYIHELIDVVGHHRARYMHHVTANWGPIGQAQRGQRCFGVWATVGSTGRWPQVVNLWEYDDWAALGRNFEIELTGDGLQDPDLEGWWAEAASMRSGGLDRILVAPPWSPSIDDLCRTGGRGAAGYVHELVTCRSGTASALLAAVRDEAVDRHGAAGLELVGAFERAMADDDEAMLIWSFPAWSTWAAYESELSARRGAITEWRRDVAELVAGWQRVAMADAPLSPLRTGRQPRVSDRRELAERPASPPRSGD